LATKSAQSRYDRFARRGVQEPIAGSALKQRENSGRRLASATNILWISSAALAVIAGGLYPFLEESGSD